MNTIFVERLQRKSIVLHCRGPYWPYHGTDTGRENFIDRHFVRRHLRYPAHLGS